MTDRCLDEEDYVWEITDFGVQTHINGDKIRVCREVLIHHKESGAKSLVVIPKDAMEFFKIEGSVDTRKEEMLNQLVSMDRKDWPINDPT